jgi:hypothetical protein
MQPHFCVLNEKNMTHTIKNAAVKYAIVEVIVTILAANILL